MTGRTFHGTVSKIAEKADDRSRVFDIEATVDNPDQALKIGFIATAELDELPSTQSRVAVPLSAIVQVPQKRDSFAVFVVTDPNARSVASLRPVVLGDLVRNDVTVTEGIVPGESIIVLGANHVRDGEQVSVIP
jgi:multidrug efflux pump subunit AcrA (membrane-fusion protein)